MSVSLSNILTYFLVIFIYQEHEFVSDFLKENALKIIQACATMCLVKFPHCFHSQSTFV